MTALPRIRAFFDEPTFTASYLVWDEASRRAAIIDSVLDFEPKSGSTGTASAQAILDVAASEHLTIDWILETHAHADHISAAPFLKHATGANTVIGADITATQRVFKHVYNLPDLAEDGSQFDRLVKDGDALPLGELEIKVMHTPGHTPACVSYLVGDAVFVGDTMFMPDYGTARTDFPGGDARALYHSIKRLLALPPETRLFLCHDYKGPGRDAYVWETNVAAQRAGNIHIHDGVTEEGFVAQRQARDKTLGKPALILPSIQVNIRAGELPAPEANGIRYLKLPLDAL
jgi:glyoxylase-like metal-dependent hydrolase (beta-lactamase superfamily II)